MPLLVIMTAAPDRTKPDPKLLWQGGLSNEIAFWQRYLATEGGEWPGDFQRRLSPDTPLQKFVIRHLAQLPGSEFSILDVGAGPLTVLGKRWPGKRVRITPVDPLAAEYDRILASLGIVPMIRTLECEGEQLSSRFPPDSFDLVWSQNAVDHSYDPRLVIEQALTVVKNGGYVLLNHARNEGENEAYVGLHQWNFAMEDGAFVIWNPSMRIDMTRHLEPHAEVWGTEEAEVKGWIEVAIRKVANPSLWSRLTARVAKRVRARRDARLARSRSV